MRNDLEELEKMFGKVLDSFPQERRKLVENSGDKLHERVLRNIDRDVKPKTGKLRAACEKHIGSGGGYAAIRNNHKKAPHAHLIEEGHNLYRGKKGKGGKVIKEVKGKFMYRNAANALADELEKDAEQTIEKCLKEAGFS